MLIGGGADGTGTSGGGSGAVTVWYGAAQHVPNILYVVAVNASNGQASQIYFDPRQVYLLLEANSGSGATAGAATASNEFAASGFYQSTAGQNGSTTTIAASTTTFLSGGAQSTGSDVVANYGYDSTAINAQGYFQLQPIIVGVGASGGSKGGIGCGGGGSLPGIGGPGMVLIASW